MKRRVDARRVRRKQSPRRRAIVIRVAMPWSLKHRSWVRVLRPQINAAARDARSRLIARGAAKPGARVCEVRLMKAGAPGDLRSAIRTTVSRADILVFDLASAPSSIDGNPNVLIELGMALGLGRDSDIHVIRSEGRRRPNRPSDIAGLVVHGPADLRTGGSLHGLLREAVIRKWCEAIGTAGARR